MGAKCCIEVGREDYVAVLVGARSHDFLIQAITASASVRMNRSGGLTFRAELPTLANVLQFA
jgi:hypothetical protein